MKKSSGQIVRRYSVAMFESAVESKSVAEVTSQVRMMSNAFCADIQEFFMSPRIEESQKISVIESLIQEKKLAPALAGTLRVLLANGRFSLITEVLADYLVKSDALEGIVRAEVVSAHALSASEVKEFESSLALALKQKVTLSQSVDSALRAGFIVKMGNTVVDASLRSRLLSLKESLSQGV